MSITVHIVDDAGYRKTESTDGLRELLANPTNTVWIDSSERNDVLEKFLAETLQLHPLAIEDIFSERLTPKVEDYGDYLYVVMHGVRRDAEDPEALGTMEIDVVLGPNWVFTHHALPSRSVEAVQAELARSARAIKRGAAYVAHAVLDHLSDFYLPVLERFEEEIYECEKAVVDDPQPTMLQRLFQMKSAIQRLRRLAVYQRDVLQRLSRGEFDHVPEKALPFYRDVFDQFVRIADLADNHRELVSSALQVYMSVTANKTNEIMKALALISTLMLPLTFIAGVYGMNFDKMPEIHWKYGYPMALGSMAIVAALLVLWFKRRRWL